MPRQADVAVLVALLIPCGLLGAIGYVCFLIVRWACRTGRRLWLWLLGAYVAANILWAILRPYLTPK
jgi:hypothetical protein